MTHTRSVKQLYRQRVKDSHCRGKTMTTCRHRNGCKRTMKGKRRSYCRKTKNHRVKH